VPVDLNPPTTSFRPNFHPHTQKKNKNVSGSPRVFHPRRWQFRPIFPLIELTGVVFSTYRSRLLNFAFFRLEAGYFSPFPPFGQRGRPRGLFPLLRGTLPFPFPFRLTVPPLPPIPPPIEPLFSRLPPSPPPNSLRAILPLTAERSHGPSQPFHRS